MTQNKNKKGIAKKALSISLVAAMLATSNVPVWASFEAVDDASGFTLEEAAPAEVTTSVDNTDLQTAEADVNVDNAFNDETIKLDQDVAWGTPVGITGDLTRNDGASFTYTYRWLAGGVEVHVSKGEVKDALNTKKYTPAQKDYGKELLLEVTVKNANDGVIYRKTFSAGTVQAKNLSGIPAPKLNSSYTYTGKECKVTPENYNDNTFASLGEGDLTADCFDIVYAQEDGDYTNVDNTNGISVTYVVNENGKKLGYTGKSSSTTYKIAPKGISADDFVLTLNNTSYEYTGQAINFTKDDVKLVEKNTGIDVTASIKNIKTTDGPACGDNYTARIYSAVTNIDTTLEATKSVWTNYDLSTPIDIVSSNTYSIVPRDFSQSTAKLNQVFITGSSATDIINYINGHKNIVSITGKDGKTVTLADLVGNDLQLSLTDAARAAITAKQPTTITGGVVLSASGVTTNYVNSVSMDLVLAGGLFGNVQVGNLILDTIKPSSAQAATYKVPYNGKAHDLKSLTGFIVKYFGSNDIVATSNYDITYEVDNINAGIVKATITGKDSYKGEQKVVYFGITPASIAADNVSAEKELTINYANDANAALYKDAFGLKVETTLDGQKVVLAEGTDYTVEYFYTKDPVNDVVTAKVAATGENAVGNYVTAKITLTKDGNYKDNGIEYVSLPLVEKSIENVTIIINPESYTYTGKEITPTVIVKDGSRYLYAGEDYTLKLKNNINVGNATATIVAKKDSGYKEGTEASKDFAITPANAEDVKVTFGYTAKQDADNDGIPEYTGRQIKPSITAIELNGVDVKDQFSIAADRLIYGENINAGKDMGSVTISPKTGNKNFTGTKTATFDIKGKALTGTLKVYDENGKEITGTPEYRYTGSEITFAKAVFTPSDKTLNLVEGVDYEIVYIDNVYPVGIGASHIAVIAKGNYETDKSITAADKTIIKNVVAQFDFTITGATFSSKDVTISNGVYAGGLVVKPQVTVKVNDYVLVEGKDYKVTSTPATEATVGKPYDVKVEGIGAWANSNTVINNEKWGIDKRNLKDCDVTVVNGATTVKIGEITVPASNYTVTDNGDGSYTVAATANNKNLTGSVTVLESATQAPASTTLRVTDRTTSTVSLAWDKVSGAEGYTIWFRSEYDTKVSRKIIQGGDVTSWTQNGLQPGTKYFYTIRAWVKDDTGYVFGEQSPVQRGTTKPIAAVVKSASATNGYIKVVLAGKAAGAKMYSMCYSKSANFNDFAVGIRTSYTTRSFTKAVKAGTYYVRVKSYRDLGNNKRVYGAWSNAVKVVVK